MDKKEVKLLRERFKNHTATLKIIDKDTQEIIWKEEENSIYMIRYLFRNKHLFISGDVGCAVYYLEWAPKWDYAWESLDIDYFSSKCAATERGKTIWTTQYAIEDLKTYYRDIFTNLEDEQYEKLVKTITETARWYAIDEFNVEEVIEEALGDERDVVYGYRDEILGFARLVDLANDAYSEEEFKAMVDSDDYKRFYESYIGELYDCGNRTAPELKMYLMGLIMAKESLSKTSCFYKR